MGSIIALPLTFVAGLISFNFSDVIYLLKWTIAYIAIRIHNAYHSKRFDLYQPDIRNDPEKTGFIIPQVETDLESPLSESHLEEAADEVLFYGVNSKSECLLVRINRGCDQVAEAWIYLKLENGKSYHLSENVDYQQPFDKKSLTFSCGHLQMHFLSAMRRWRISYSGLLREESKDKDIPDGDIFVKFVFLWAASSDIYDFTLYSNPGGSASAMAKTDWTSFFHPPIKKFSKALNFYAQVGVLRGNISVDDGPDYDMYLFGEKLRNMGNTADIAGCVFNTLFGYIPDNGFGFHLSKASEPFENLPLGFMIEPGGQINAVKDLDMELKSYGAANARKQLEICFTADTSYVVSGTISQKPIIHLTGHSSCEFFDVSFLSFNIQDKSGYGFIISGKAQNVSEQSSIPILSLKKTVHPIQKDIPLTVKFSDEISTSSEVSGGKGSSLGKLTKLSSFDQTFIVPNGIIVTTSAYQLFLTSQIKKEIKHLEDVVFGNVAGDVKITCETVSKVVIDTVLPNEICQSIKKNLQSVFNEKIATQKFAVRSSATGEDTDVMSAAGQMDTFLGIEGLENIFMAVKKCWASQFGHIAVEYKRQNGQLLNSPMAVVIQEMVACEVSGVLFTCNPVTNNPTIITITANYGLGESVVSGTVEPDTIMFQRTTDHDLILKSVNVGSKHQKIVMRDSGGTVLQSIPEDSRKNNCLNEDMARRLGNLGIKVEHFYRSPRDIEWGVLDGDIFLLQSRPVTSGAAGSDFEIKHEFDSPLRCERDFLSVSNVGEVMPGATSPLGMELIQKYFDAAFTREAFSKGIMERFSQSKYFFSGMMTSYYHMMIPVVEIISRSGHESTLSKGFMIGIFGRILDDPEIFQLAKEKVKENPKKSIFGILSFLKDIFFYDLKFKNLKLRVENYDLPYLQCKTAEETFKALMKSCSDFDEIFLQHVHSTGASSCWNAFMFLVLCRAKGGIDTDIYSDFARLLSTSSNLESADVPTAMQNLANQIVKDVGKEDFQNMTLQEAENWLKKSTSPAGNMFRQFLQRHGHRCLKEFDVHSLTWENEPEMFIKLLQTLSSSVKAVETKVDDDYDKIFSELNAPLNFTNRCLLKFILPNCRKGVRSREACKSILIKCMDYWRRGYRHLGKLMIAEGFIPDAKLLYFMTMMEVKDLLSTRYPKIIARASSRKKMFSTLEEYKFPEIMRGIPKPINEDDSSDTYEFVADLTMQGIPVSQGVTKGYARVAISLEEASLLKVY